MYHFDLNFCLLIFGLTPNYNLSNQVQAHFVQLKLSNLQNFIPL